ncbi:sensor domain-containing diguanylate cyclase [Halopseudomonas pelagia]|uniref:diguanylate cyclase n=1 Tax=Halopseudomonas pelagia TaxID=553151 RepID=A0AA91U5U4_9GAMM|nr:sensor domain-containing diguanylate cyclase [Halopseudomonas pelagia]PCD00931.1 diguanylate cyclase [Halopseudomonas pelagia]QFY58912.1 GGDEF domain-containing protein [Halopseudomonas pelagia]
MKTTQKIPASILLRLAESTAFPSRLAEVVRPLLDLLEEMTGLESTYFTVIDEVKGIQTVVYAKNTRRLNIPEGLTVPWGDTLCRRAIIEERHYTSDVPGVWGDSNAARELGICTYLSEPIRLINNTLYGTLCAASEQPLSVSEKSLHYLSLFSSLIARYIESEKLLDILINENQILTRHALTDPLTGIPNRRALMRSLSEQLQHAHNAGKRLHVAFIDLDGFKEINDRYGHDAGDRFLIHIARVLVEQRPEADTVARYGGDEFVLFRLSSGDDHQQACIALRDELESVTRGSYEVCGETIEYAGASVGVITTEPGQFDPEEVLQLSDTAMYQQKRERKSKPSAEGHS